MISDRRSLTGMKVLIKKDKKQQHRAEGKHGGGIEFPPEIVVGPGSRGRFHQ